MQGRPPFDMGNPYLSSVESELTTSLVNTPAGQQAAVTLRTTSATVTVFLEKATLKAWAAQLANTETAMTGLILPHGGLLP